MPFISILGSATAPIGSVDIPFQEPASIKRSNGLWDGLPWVFNKTSGLVTLAVSFPIPDTYSGTPAIDLVLYSTAIVGDMVFDIDYNVIDTNEDFDPATWQRSVSGTLTVNGTTLHRSVLSIGLTAGDFTGHAGGTVEAYISRDGGDAADTMAAAAILSEARFDFDDT